MTPEYQGEALEFLLEAGSEPVPGYRLIKWIGGGGAGEVWRAEGPGGFQVAMKFVRLEEGTGESEERALELIKTIRHPNLLHTFGAWHAGNRLIIAMELADRTLLDRYKEALDQGHAGIPRDEVLEYFREAAKGIDYLNEPRHALGGKEHMGIQHRDIKPQNILLVGGGVKVGDFGLARHLERSMTGHTGLMTIAYAAPEFFEGKTSNRSDQYCLAMSYCQLRGGRLPFAGSQAEITTGIIAQPPDLSMVPEEEQPILLRALSKQPEERWPSCRAFVKALQACAPEEAPGSVGSVTALEPTARPSETADTPSTSKGLNYARTERASGPALKAAPVDSSPATPRRNTALMLVAAVVLAAAAGVGLWAAGLLPGMKQETALPLAGTTARTSEPSKELVGDTSPLVPVTPIVEQPKPALKLFPPARLAVKIGQKQNFLVRVERSHCEGPIDITFETAGKLPLRPLTIAPDKDSAEATLEIDSAVALGDHKVEVQARHGATTATAGFLLTVAKAPKLTLILPESVTIQAGDKGQFVLRIEREGFAGPVLLRFAALPDGVRLRDELTIPADATEATVAVTIDAKAQPGTKAMQVTAVSDSAKTEGRLQITLKPAPRLTLETPDPLTVQTGEKTRLKIRVQRENVAGPVTLGLAGLPPGLRLTKEVLVPAAADEAELEVSTGEEILEGTHKIKLLGAIGLLKEERTVPLVVKFGPVMALLQEGRMFLEKSDCDRAIAAFTAAHALDPKRALVLTNRAEAYTRKREYDTAIADCDAALKMDSRNDVAYMARGAAHHQKGQLEKAIDDYSTAITLRTAGGLSTDAMLTAMSHYSRASAYEAKGEVAKALADLTQAIELGKTDAAVYNSRGSLYVKFSRFDEALADFSAAIQRDPKLAAAYHNRGIAHARKKDFEQALRDVGVALQLDRKLVPAYLDRAALYFQLGDGASALKDLSTAIDLEPTAAGNYEKRATVYDKTGDAARARADREKAEQLRKMKG